MGSSSIFRALKIGGIFATPSASGLKKWVRLSFLRDLEIVLCIIEVEYVGGRFETVLVPLLSI